jgi:hypothetical protein
LATHNSNNNKKGLPRAVLLKYCIKHTIIFSQPYFLYIFFTKLAILMSGGANMKNSTTKSTKSTKSKAKTTGSKKSGCCCKASSQESESDPFGSYTGKPVGWGIDEPTVQDADDL